MRNLFKKVKFEFFFLRKLFGQRRPLVHYFSYFKNRFFGGYLLNKIDRHDCRGERPSGFELHILSQKDSSSRWMLYWAIRSFLYHSELCPSVVVHDDGSWDVETAKKFESKFSNVRVLMREDADREIEKMDYVPDKIKRLRYLKGVPILKMTDVFLLSHARRVMILGNDVLFFKKPEEIVEFAKGISPYDALVSYELGDWPVNVTEEYAKKYKLFENNIMRMNSDLIMFRKDLISLERFLEYFDHTTKPENDYFIEMTGLNSLIIQLGNFKILPHERYAIKGGINPEMVSKHFTGPRRHEMFARGISIIREQIENNKGSKKTP